MSPPAVPMLTLVPRRESASRVIAGPILHLVTSRSSALRLAPLASELRDRGVEQAVLDPSSPLERLELPPLDRMPTAAGPDQTADAMAIVEEHVSNSRPAGVVVAGDSDLAVACALAALKLGVPVVRLGAGLRCHDWALRDEMNRHLLDALAELLLADHSEAGDTLVAAGVPADRIRVVGSTLADLALSNQEAAAARAPWKRFGLARENYVLLTLHRRENLGSPAQIKRIVDAIVALSEKAPVIFVLHPRTREALEPLGALRRLKLAGVVFSDPLGYLDFLGLEAGSCAVVTDSGGVQEETTTLGVPCFTLRATTERVATLIEGTNVLLGEDPVDIASVWLAAHNPPSAVPHWDRHVRVRAVDAILTWAGAR
jgi:UDP-N-acetylglucosamine 2-epimerase (non-hydrolysing)